MNCLAFDTSGSHLTTILIKDGEEFYNYLEDCHLKHSILLMQEVEKLFEEAKLTPKDIDVFGCTIGPGSFTGIRIGVSTVKAFSYANSKKVLGVTSFDVLVGNDKRKVLTCIDAGHDNYYVAGYVSGEIILSPTFVTIDDVKELSKEYIVLASKEIEGVETNIRSLKEGFIEAIKKNICKAVDDREQIVPMYIKRSQAEENRC